MNAEQEAHVELWVEDLLSGKFAQTINRLRDEKGYCCLGVACERFRQETGIGNWGPDLTFRMDDGPYGAALPNAVKEWYGLSDTEGQFDGTSSLTLRNDTGQTFEEIAALIKRRPKGLFQEEDDVQ